MGVEKLKDRLTKIAAELQDIVDDKRREAWDIVESRVPGLKWFIIAGKIGNLESAIEDIRKVIDTDYNEQEFNIGGNDG